MTADVEVLPLPDTYSVAEVALRGDGKWVRREDFDWHIRQDRARATAARDAEIAGWKLAEKSEYDLRMKAEAEIEALREEVDALKRMLGECYVEAGADTDGDDPSHLYAHALSAVQDLRRDYDETLAEPDYKARAERLAEALREARQMIRDLLPDATFTKWDALLREQGADNGESGG